MDGWIYIFYCWLQEQMLYLWGNHNKKSNRGASALGIRTIATKISYQRSQTSRKYSDYSNRFEFGTLAFTPLFFIHVDAMSSSSSSMVVNNKRWLPTSKQASSKENSLFETSLWRSQSRHRMSRKWRWSNKHRDGRRGCRRRRCTHMHINKQYSPCYSHSCSG